MKSEERLSGGRDRKPPGFSKPRAISRREVALRELIAEALPFRGDVMAMPGLAAVARWKSASLRLEGVRFDVVDDLPRGVVIALSSGGIRSVLVLEERLVGRLVDGVLGRPSSIRRAPLTSGEEGALLYAVDKAGGDWIDAGGPRFTVRGLLADNRQIAEYAHDAAVLVDGSIEHDLEEGRVAFIGPPPAGRMDVRAAHGRPRWARCARWPLKVRVIVGDTCIDAAAAQALRAGDVVTLERWSHPLAPMGTMAAIVEIGGIPHRARWVDPRGLKLVSNEGRSSNMEEETDDIKLALRGPTRGDAAFQVTLRAVVGEATMPVERALRLSPGLVLTLDQPVGTMVRVMCGEAVVAKGELVEVEGVLAVEITEVS